jgi:3-hydroxyethyl bacteriochlorophyllide a dehydrogenase
MDSLAIVIEAPGRLSLHPLALDPMGEADILVEIAWSGISAGTERLLWSGNMPFFPGLAYPLVPGYESVGRVIDAGPIARSRIGEWVFVPGARCFQGAHGLFGGAAQRVVVPAARALPIPEKLGEQGVLIALAATAHHMLAGADLPELIVGHGVLGRLLARLTVALGAPPPVVWEKNQLRRGEAQGYPVLDPDADERRDYRAIYDVSGDGSLIDGLISRLAKRGELVLGGFYREPLSFAFPAAFQREARLRVAAEWSPEDLAAVRGLIADGRLDLAGLVTDVRPADEAAEAYEFAFNDPRCLKMVIDWRAWA